MCVGGGNVGTQPIYTAIRTEDVRAESTFRYGRRVNIRGSGMAQLESIVVPSPSSQCRPPATPALTRPKAPSPAHGTAPSSSSTLLSSSPPSRPCLLPASLLTPLSYVIPPSLPPSSVLPPPFSLRPPPSALGPPPSSLILPPSSVLPPRSSPTWCHESYSLHPPRRPRPAGVRPGHEQVGRSAGRVWLEQSVSRKRSKLSALKNFRIREGARFSGKEKKEKKKERRRGKRKGYGAHMKQRRQEELPQWCP